MSVIAHGHGAGLAGQGLEPAEMGDPFGIRQRLQPHARRRPVVADAQDRLREVGGAHGVAIVPAQGEELRIGTKGGRDGHPAQMRLLIFARNRPVSVEHNPPSRMIVGRDPAGVPVRLARP